jgi:hypothetical protein
MTDHFKDCRPGDVVTVTSAYTGKFSDVARHGYDVLVGRLHYKRDDPAIVSVTVEPRPLKVGDRVIEAGDMKKAPGTLVAIGREFGLVIWDYCDQELPHPLSNLEHVND